MLIVETTVQKQMETKKVRLRQTSQCIYHSRLGLGVAALRLREQYRICKTEVM